MVDLGWGEHGVPRMGEHGVPKEGEHGELEEGEHGAPEEGEHGALEEGEHGVPSPPFLITSLSKLSRCAMPLQMRMPTAAVNGALSAAIARNACRASYGRSCLPALDREKGVRTLG